MQEGGAEGGTTGAEPASPEPDLPACPPPASQQEEESSEEDEEDDSEDEEDEDSSPPPGLAPPPCPPPQLTGASERERTADPEPQENAVKKD